MTIKIYGNGSSDYSNHEGAAEDREDYGLGAVKPNPFVKKHAQPETTHEKDFIEKTLSEYERRWNYHGVFQNKEAYPQVAAFLKEKLAEAMKIGKDYYYQLGISDEGDRVEDKLQEMEERGRLAMRQEIVKILEENFEYLLDRNQKEKAREIEFVLNLIRDID